jgi:hypothetical protein
MNRRIRYRWWDWLLCSMVVMFGLSSCAVRLQPNGASVESGTLSEPLQTTKDLATESKSVAVNKLGFNVQGWT